MGQAAKKRHCPALQSQITSAECGENRQSRYRCPPDCAFNPFAPENYGVLLEEEDRLDVLAMKRLAAEVPSAINEIMRAGRANTGHGHHAATVWNLFFKRDIQGRTAAARWIETGLNGMKNDFRVFLRHKAQMRVALLEVQTVIDDQTTQVVDLLDPTQAVLKVVDRQTAAQAVRFATVLTWIYPLPHFWRMSGTGIMMPELGTLTPQFAMEQWIAHLGGPSLPGAERADWLAENFCRIDQAVTATSLERRRLMFEGMDAQFGVATYKLTGSSAQCRKTLAAHPELSPDEPTGEEQAEGFDSCWAWLDSATGNEVLAGSQAVKGRVLLGKGRSRLEAMGAARLADLRARFEGRMGALAEFTGERRDDVAKRMLLDEPVSDLALVPPVLLKQIEKFELQSSLLPASPPGVSLEDYSAQAKKSFRRHLLDQPIPALEGRTPREAAGIPGLRPRLLDLMKLHVRNLDKENLQTGRTEDINVLLRELGLHEIDFPPPPARAIPPVKSAEVDNLADDYDYDDEDSDSLDEDEVLDADPHRPPAPVLVGRALTFEESIDRLEAVMDGLATARAGFMELDLSGSNLYTAADVLTKDLLDEQEFSFFITFAMQAWFALVPKGVRAPTLRIELIRASHATISEELATTALKQNRALEQLGSNCRQPDLFAALSAGMIESSGKLPESMRPAPTAVVDMIILIRVILDELDYALRTGMVC